MSLGTIDRTPPPFFRQGPSALTKLAFFSALALFLMVADTRFEFAQPLRAALTGQTTSPGIFDVLVLLGRTESLARIGAQVPAVAGNQA